MNPIIQDLFTRAVELPGSERDAFLAQACGDDAELRLEVQRMLVDAARADSFFGDTDGATLGAEEFKDSYSEKAGDVVGPYKLREQIGEGGFGSVWVADQEKPVRRRVALKLVKAGMDTKQVIARFEQERQALAMMDHPNIAKVFDAGTTGQGRPYFVMELVRGVPITEYCDEKSLGTQQRLDLFILVCQAVQHAHQKGIIHRDLKPSNILVTVNDGKPVPKVIDFGVAKATQGRLVEQTIYTQFQQMIGTPLYMSPEQADMTSLDVDTRSDIYSLGVLLYELLTGRTPIDAATMREAGLDEMRRIIREVDPPRPSLRLKTLEGDELTSTAKRRHTEPAKLPATLRGDLDWIVMKCLEKDRMRRYDTANGLALDLQRHLNHDAITARPPTTTYLIGRLVRRNKAAFVAASAVLLALVIGTVASTWQALRAKAAEQHALAAFDELRATAPAFAEQARALAAKEEYGEAIEKLDYAIKLRPDAAEYFVAKADLLQCQFKLADAAAIYRAALALQPAHPRAGDSLKLCEELLAAPTGPDGELTRESLGKLDLAMQKQQRPAAELLPVARLLGAEKEHLVAYWLDRLKDLPISAGRPLQERLTMGEDSLLELDLSGTQITDLAVLSGMPLGELELWNCRQIVDFTPLGEFRSLTYLDLGGSQIDDLSVLRGLPLETLHIGGTKVSDLSPIRGLKLKTLGIYGSRRVSDLSPLAGMPLTAFYAMSIANRTDFSPLKGLPLETCIISDSSVADLSFLAACPLRALGLYSCDFLRGLDWLNEIKSLERLVLPRFHRNLPDADLQAIAALRDHPRLAFIQGDAFSSNSNEDWRTFHVTQSKAVFWRDWDREQTFLPAIREAGLTFELTKLPNDSYRLRIQNQPLRDLLILEDKPISELYIGGTQVTDLSPIAELPLRVLEFSLADVTDLSPLRKMPLEQLTLGSGAVADLSPLAGMPLQKLYMHQCKTVGDLSPILNLQTLQSLTIPVTARNIESLRSLKSLRWLGFRGDTRVAVGSTPVDLFWKRWPGMAWSRALNESGIDYTATQADDGLWSVKIKSKEFTDCGIFKGADLGELILQDTSVSELRPLEGLALTKLHLHNTGVTDLAPLRGMPLRELNIHGTRIANLTALRGMQLQSLVLSETPVTDLSPLEGMPLTKLHVGGTRIADVSALRGMPLVEVRMPWCPRITDLTPLADAVALVFITLPPNAEEIEFLQDITTLRRISFTEKIKENTTSYQPDQTADQFWKDYDKAGWRTALRKAGIIPKTQRQLPDRTWEVDLERSGITSLEILRDAEISILRLGNTAVSDLKPLSGMALKHLALYNTKVSDLRPLEGMPLENLSVSGTDVDDISVLRGMPLSRVRLHGCKNLKNLSPLEDCTKLTDLTLPPNALDYGFLRDSTRFPELKHLSFTEDKPEAGTRMPDKTAREFWEQHVSEEP